MNSSRPVLSHAKRVREDLAMWLHHQPSLLHLNFICVSFRGNECDGTKASGSEIRGCGASEKWENLQQTRRLIPKWTYMEGRGGRRKREREWYEKSRRVGTDLREGCGRNGKIRWKEVLWEVTKQTVERREEQGEAERAAMFIRKSQVTSESFDIIYNIYPHLVCFLLLRKYVLGK